MLILCFVTNCAVYCVIIYLSRNSSTMLLCTCRSYLWNIIILLPFTELLILQLVDRKLVSCIPMFAFYDRADICMIIFLCCFLFVTVVSYPIFSHKKYFICTRLTSLWSLAWGCGARIPHEAPQKPKKRAAEWQLRPSLVYLCSYLGARLPLEVLLLTLSYCSAQRIRKPRRELAKQGQYGLS